MHRFGKSDPLFGNRRRFQPSNRRLTKILYARYVFSSFFWWIRLFSLTALTLTAFACHTAGLTNTCRLLNAEPDASFDMLLQVSCCTRLGNLTFLDPEKVRVAGDAYRPILVRGLMGLLLLAACYFGALFANFGLNRTRSRFLRVLEKIRVKTINSTPAWPIRRRRSFKAFFDAAPHSGRAPF